MNICQLLPKVTSVTVIVSKDFLKPDVKRWITGALGRDGEWRNPYLSHSVICKDYLIKINT